MLMYSGHLTLWGDFTHCSGVSIIDSEQANTSISIAEDYWKHWNEGGHWHEKGELPLLEVTYPAGNYMFKANNRNTITRCEMWFFD